MCSIMGFIRRGTDLNQAKSAFEKTISRGPDAMRFEEAGSGWLGFQRLSIMGLTDEGMQPFHLGGDMAVCNGELYGFREVKEELQKKGYSFRSDSDCEIILPLYRELGVSMFETLDAEFAMIIYDSEKQDFIAARDPIGIRPLHYGYQEDGSIVFASEAKNLIGLCERIMPFPPGCYYADGHFTRYAEIYKGRKAFAKKDEVSGESFDPTAELSVAGLQGAPTPVCKVTADEASEKIRELLIRAVGKRLDADAPVGFLLSGGLDSSLVCAISARILKKPIRTFAIGMNTDAIDLKYAKQAAEYLGAEHTEVIITEEDVIRSLPEVVAALGTYDITTIRASMGMYLCCKYIHEHTDVRVLLTGEVSDELFGYKYTDFAPSAKEFQKEAEKRVRELNVYDVLRADRCISVHSMEARVPFGDLDFVSYVMSLDPEIKMNVYGKGKYLLRHAFEEGAYLPYDLLMREKAAFSDAVGHSMVDDLKAYAERTYTDEEFEELRKKYTYAQPFTKESLLYRELFEQYYPGQAEMIPDFWMPNRSWEGCNVNDPSARVLGNYGASGI
ncbi:MAG: asparagine synthase B [Lachnospiraceae bacterium]|nr:asparagine synthase B [Lachnospiraceae bacterium]